MFLLLLICGHMKGPASLCGSRRHVIPMKYVTDEITFCSARIREKIGGLGCPGQERRVNCDAVENRRDSFKPERP